jgi:hypothetical protein
MELMELVEGLYGEARKVIAGICSGKRGGNAA